MTYNANENDNHQKQSRRPHFTLYLVGTLGVESFICKAISL